MIPAATVPDLYSLKLHETLTPRTIGHIEILRVPGGWLYFRHTQDLGGVWRATRVSPCRPHTTGATSMRTSQIQELQDSPIGFHDSCGNSRSPRICAVRKATKRTVAEFSKDAQGHYSIVWMASQWVMGQQEFEMLATKLLELNRQETQNEAARTD